VFLSRDETVIVDIRLLLGATLHQVLDPIVLEVIAVRIESLRLCDDLNLLIVVRSSTVGCDDSSLKVGVLEVSARVVLQVGVVLSPLTLFE